MAEACGAMPKRLCLAVATRARPGMLSNLVMALRSVETPDDTNVTFLVVENGPEVIVRPLLDRWEVDGSFKWPCDYLHIAAPGLVHARNAAIEHALATSQDWLAFIDDDEEPESGWLKALVAGETQSGAALAGGPVRPIVRKTPETVQTRAIWRGYLRRSKRKTAMALFYKQAGIVNVTTISTNNCLIDLRFIRQRGLRFDYRFNFSGGEDTAFFRDTLRFGGLTAWVPEAVVLEEVPEERLTFAYQYARARDQSMVTCRRKLEENRILTLVSAPLSAVFSLVVGVLLLAIAGPTLLRTLYPAARRLGAAAGRVGGLVGRSSLHYREASGY